MANASAYHQWVAQFAAGLGRRPAAVLLEPDALGQLDCLSSAAQTDRLAMLRDAVTVLTASPATAVYLDAGHAGWKSSSEMVTRLNAAGLSMVRGFSLNVSGFDETSDEVSYGEEIASLTGKHYVVDTSRNGLGMGSTTCNPDGRALGDAPTAFTSGAHADAYLWVKHPGESDGDCGTGQPVAGTWMVDYAEGLASRAGW